MTNPLRISVAAIAVLALLGGFAFYVAGASAQPAPSTLPYKLYAPIVARDGVAAQPTTPGGNLPPADPSYCPGSSGTSAPPSPPNSVIGLITIGGVQAPAGTLIQIVFDGKVGPAARTAAAGGYRVDYAGGTAGCANQVGATIGIRINGGTTITSTVKVGDSAANPFLRFDIAAP